MAGKKTKAARVPRAPKLRAPRADAQRNRAALLKSAKGVLAARGAEASLEEIARAAGVGIGTLYRHFPTRDALVEALYGHEVDQLVAEAARLSVAQPPIRALREWLLLFVDYIVTKQAMADVLKTIVGSSSYAASGTQMKDTGAALVARAVAAGAMSGKVEALDLLRALSGVASLSAGPNARQAARQMVDILIAGVAQT